MTEPEYVLRASMPRRVFGTAMLAMLGAILLWLALTGAEGGAWRLVLVALGLAALWMARGLWRSTAGHVALTAAGLEDHTGRVLARIEDMAAVDRGTFAFKPSNGLLVKLHDRAEPAGRRGCGGAFTGGWASAV